MPISATHQALNRPPVGPVQPEQVGEEGLATDPPTGELAVSAGVSPRTLHGCSLLKAAACGALGIFGARTAIIMRTTQGPYPAGIQGKMLAYAGLVLKPSQDPYPDTWPDCDEPAQVRALGADLVDAEVDLAIVGDWHGLTGDPELVAALANGALDRTGRIHFHQEVHTGDDAALARGMADPERREAVVTFLGEVMTNLKPERAGQGVQRLHEVLQRHEVGLNMLSFVNARRADMAALLKDPVFSIALMGLAHADREIEPVNVQNDRINGLRLPLPPLLQSPPLSQKQQAGRFNAFAQALEKGKKAVLIVNGQMWGKGFYEHDRFVEYFRCDKGLAVRELPLGNGVKVTVVGPVGLLQNLSSLDRMADEGVTLHMPGCTPPPELPRQHDEL